VLLLIEKLAVLVCFYMRWEFAAGAGESWLDTGNPLRLELT